jgi:hypothetical protein
MSLARYVRLEKRRDSTADHSTVSVESFRSYSILSCFLCIVFRSVSGPIGFRPVLFVWFSFCFRLYSFPSCFSTNLRVDVREGHTDLLTYSFLSGIETHFTA